MRIIPSLFMLVAGCDIFGTVRPAGRPVSEAYGGSLELRVLDVEAPLAPEKRIPLMSSPEVFACFSSPHVDGDVFYGSRWVAIRLRDSQWYVERLREPDPPATGEAPPEAMRPLKDLDWEKGVIPHRN